MGKWGFVDTLLFDYYPNALWVPSFQLGSQTFDFQGFSLRWCHFPSVFSPRACLHQLVLPVMCFCGPFYVATLVRVLDTWAVFETSARFRATFPYSFGFCLYTLLIFPLCTQEAPDYLQSWGCFSLLSSLYLRVGNLTHLSSSLFLLSASSNLLLNLSNGLFSSQPHNYFFSK